MDSSRFVITLPSSKDTGDEDLAQDLAALVNDAYMAAESEFWQPGTRRTSPRDIGRLLAAGELAVARTQRNGRVVGCVHLQDVDADTFGFGMLVTAPSVRGAGLGRALVGFVEAEAVLRGRPKVRLELLVPQGGWHHADKERLAVWYRHLGYEMVRVAPLAESYPLLVPRSARGAAVQVREKRLALD